MNFVITDKSLYFKKKSSPLNHSNLFNLLYFGLLENKISANEMSSGCLSRDLSFNLVKVSIDASEHSTFTAVLKSPSLIFLVTTFTIRSSEKTLIFFQNNEKRLDSIKLSIPDRVSFTVVILLNL